MKMYFNAFNFLGDVRIESEGKTCEQAVNDIYDYYMSNYAFTIKIDGDNVSKVDLMPEVPLTAWEIEGCRHDDNRKEC